ncbi:gamma-glutamyl-gamma-aminobutyrate hydrolase family protein [Bifidobacterium biavatii]|uniref:Putative glutamine amidotransferase n=1 Tax=Bifidobacterium biavatii DSM 23969 TaxID=1437608 RepID=A0A086ZT25_9BIFI|nr:gamma-glutamyl-gamma-aminobutyrate hydrolase family protein [Bifidobacterium biavatii]KFI49675.1 putative glutamine amidotransferase [Bifidobacterium biavatii DSM 23969]
MTDRSLVAVTPLMDYGRDSLWMLPGYMDAVLRAGGTPVMLPLTDDADAVEQCAERFDAFLFTGGPDVGPNVGSDVQSGVEPDVGPENKPDAGNKPDTEPNLGRDGSASLPDDTGRNEALSPERDRMESLLLPAAMRLNKPILGICRGIQFINKYLGGTLWQDLPTEHPSEVEHHMKPPYDSFGHHVELVPGTPLAELFAGQREIAVNSYHHQAVRELAPGLRVMATAPDGIVEALWRPDSRFLWAVQWHPEFLYRVDPRSQAIFNTFVAAARSR